MWLRRKDAYNAKMEVSPFQTLQTNLWWAFVTITTVGYGDSFPTTTMGRFVGVLSMLMGLVIFGVYISVVSDAFEQAEEHIIEEYEFRHRLLRNRTRRGLCEVACGADVAGCMGCRVTDNADEMDTHKIRRSTVNLMRLPEGGEVEMEPDVSEVDGSRLETPPPAPALEAEMERFEQNH